MTLGVALPTRGVLGAVRWKLAVTGRLRTGVFPGVVDDAGAVAGKVGLIRRTVTFRFMIGRVGLTGVVAAGEFLSMTPDGAVFWRTSGGSGRAFGWAGCRMMVVPLLVDWTTLDCWAPSRDWLVLMMGAVC